jgi:hypothetical protein
MADVSVMLEWLNLRIFETNLKPSLQFFFQDYSFKQLINKHAAFQSLWIKTAIIFRIKKYRLVRAKYLNARNLEIQLRRLIDEL